MNSGFYNSADFNSAEDRIIVVLTDVFGIIFHPPYSN